MSSMIRRSSASQAQVLAVPALLLLLLPACAVSVTADREQRSTSRSDLHKSLTRRVFDDILNKGDLQVFQQIYDPGFVKHVDGQRETLAEEIEDARATRAMASDLVMTIDAMIAEGDQVAVRYHATGTNDGPFAGLPPTGRRITAYGMSVYRFSGGRIAEEWTTYNALDMLAQLGHYPPSPARSP